LLTKYNYNEIEEIIRFAKLLCVDSVKVKTSIGYCANEKVKQ